MIKRIMILSRNLLLFSFFIIFFIGISDQVKAAYFSADLKEAINIECKKSVKEKKVFK